MTHKKFEGGERSPDNMTAEMKKKVYREALERAKQRHASGTYIAKLEAQLKELDTEEAEAQQPVTAKPF